MEIDSQIKRMWRGVIVLSSSLVAIIVFGMLYLLLTASLVVKELH